MDRLNKFSDKGGGGGVHKFGSRKRSRPVQQQQPQQQLPPAGAAVPIINLSNTDQEILDIKEDLNQFKRKTTDSFKQNGEEHIIITSDLNGKNDDDVNKKFKKMNDQIMSDINSLDSTFDQKLTDLKVKHTELVTEVKDFGTQVTSGFNIIQTNVVA